MPKVGPIIYFRRVWHFSVSSTITSHRHKVSQQILFQHEAKMQLFKLDGHMQLGNLYFYSN